MGFIDHLEEQHKEPVLNTGEVIQTIRNESKTIDRMIHDSATGLETKIRLLNNKLNVVNESIIIFIEETLKGEK